MDADASTLNTLVREWLELDQNQETREEVLQLQASGNHAELARRMLQRIEFGTAGLRAICGAGFALMNDLIVIQTSQVSSSPAGPFEGLCQYVKDHVRDAERRGVVIGYDHRIHSERWAALTANVFAKQGLRVFCLRNYVHTPLVPFAVAKLNAACGIMITASHNSKEYNGYKVYWENAVQIISPHDRGISAAIQRNLIPSTWNTSIGPDIIIDQTSGVKAAYFQQLKWFTNSFGGVSQTTELRIVNTSLHGVGHPFVKEAFASLNLPDFIPVSQQQEPNPEFPTVQFPNPEENGRLWVDTLMDLGLSNSKIIEDLAIECAESNNVTYIMAQDPDADRFSAAQKIEGSWHVFTGDELGSIFAARTLQMYRVSGRPLARLAMVSSTVSSRMLPHIASEEGFKYQDCLTGFKYIGNTALDLEKTGDYDVLFGYEEAIGFMFGPMIRDKDGVAGAVMFATMAYQLEEEGRTVFSYLQALYKRYGHYRTQNGYFVARDPRTKAEIFNRLRHFSSGRESIYPESIGGLSIIAIRDLTSGYDSTNPPEFKPNLPKSDDEMITFTAESDTSKVTLTIRASGTEPKIKYYLEGRSKEKEQTIKLLSAVVQEMALEWVEMEKNKLFHSE